MKISSSFAALLAAVSLTIFCASAQELQPKPGATHPTYWNFAPTPPMGWNSWDAFGATVNEAQIEAQTDYISKHLKSLGWRYVVVDIQWYEPNANGFNYRPNAALEMDKWGRLIPASSKFPSAANGAGFKALADYIHSKGLLFGVHMLRGIPRQAVVANTPIKGTTVRARDIADTTSICPWNTDMFGVDMSKPGAQAYYDSVFEQAAGWGLDFVKVDDLSQPYHTPEIEAIRRAIDKNGRPVVFSTSPGETPLSQATHVSQNANMWRMSDDFWDAWPALFEQFERARKWAPFIAPGHFPDADMLPLGAVRQVPGYTGGPWTNFTRDEQTTMMTLWAMARSPLMMGGDLLRNDPWTLSLLTNGEVIGLDQNSANNHQLFNRNGQIGWVADVPNSRDKYLALFNTRDENPVDPTRAAFRSELVTRDTPRHGVNVDVDIAGAKKLFLVVDDGGDNFNSDHADWVEPRLVGPKGEAKLSALKPAKATTGWGEISMLNGASGRPMSVGGQPVSFGIGAHAPSVLEFDLPAGYMRFKAFAALDDGGVSQPAPGSTVHFLVFTQSPFSNDGSVPVSPRELGFIGAVKVRDLWAKKELGRVTDTFAPLIASHGAGLYRVSADK